MLRSRRTYIKSKAKVEAMRNIARARSSRRPPVYVAPATDVAAAAAAAAAATAATFASLSPAQVAAVLAMHA